MVVNIPEIADLKAIKTINFSQRTYCSERLKAVGISDEDNIAYENHGIKTLHFAADEGDNIIITYVHPKSNSPVLINPPGSRFSVPYRRKRFKEPVDDIKYMPCVRGVGIKPYFNGINQFYYKKGLKIPDTVFLIEGEFKAFVACKNGVAAIGIPGIHCFAHTIRDDNGKRIGSKLLEELEEFIREHKIKNLVLLHDNDANKNDNKPERALSFWTSLRNFVDATKYLGLTRYYGYLKDNEKGSKGLDDAYVDFHDEKSLLTECVLSLKSNRFIEYANLEESNIDSFLSFFKVQIKTPTDLVLKELYDLALQRNEITGFLELGGIAQSEREINTLFLEISNRIKISYTLWGIIINSTKIKSYNPLVDFFKNNDHLKPEGLIEKLASCLPCETGMKEGSEFYPEYASTFLKKWFVGMVASIFGNNYNVLMLVVVGPKFTGKTEFFRRLLIGTGLEQYMAQSKFSEGKDSEAIMCEKLLVLNDELDSLNNREAKTFRNFISSNYYTYRPPYGKQNVTRKRLASICGTSNDKNIIADPENNRRIIPIEISRKINFELYNSIDKKELLMEAYHLFKSGFDYNLTDEEIAMLSESTKEYEITLPEYELIPKYFRLPKNGDLGVKELSSTEIKVFLEAQSRQRLNLITIGKALSSLKFKQVTKKIPGTNSTRRVYLVVEIVLSDVNSILQYN